MIKLKARKGKETIRFTLPENVEEINFGMFCDFVNAKTEIERLAVLTGLSKNDLSLVSDTNLDYVIYSNLLWLNPANLIASLNRTPPPDRINGIKLKNPEFDTLGKKLEAKAYIQQFEEGSDIMSAFGGLVEIYTGIPSDEFRDYPLSVAYPVGNFFLSKLKSYLRNGIPN